MTEINKKQDANQTKANEKIKESTKNEERSKIEKRRKDRDIH